MRSIIFVISLLLYTSVLYAQVPVITSDNYFQIGEQYIRLNKYDTELNSFSLWQNGEDVTWDFSTMDFNHPSVIQDTISGTEPYSTPFFNEEQTNYGLSNFCLKLDTELYYPEDNNYFYYLIQGDSLHFIGNWAANGGSEQWFYSFDDLRTELVFPFTYLNTILDTFESSYNDLSGSDWHYQSGSTTVFADGYGTLITPDNDTLSNVLHVTTNNTYVDSNDLFGVSNHTNVYYTWYSADFDGPILKIVMSASVDYPISNVYYYKKIMQPVGVEEYPVKKSFEIYPNPTSGSFTIRLQDLLSDESVLTIYTETGELVYKNDTVKSGALTLDIKLSSGIYFVNVTDIHGEYRVNKIVVE